MAPGATIFEERLLLILLLILSTIMDTRCYFLKTFANTQPPFGRILKGVKVPGGYMEIVQEERCSKTDVRLTCRSLNAFIFLLEAEYRSNLTKACGYSVEQLQKKKAEAQGSRKKSWSTRKPWITQRLTLRGNYIDDKEAADRTAVDLRSSLNRRCSGHQHCRYNLTTDYPGAVRWNPATLHLKYACIPEIAVQKYCNAELKVSGAEGGYVKSPGYPTYYPGENTCEWTFRTLPGQRIVLTFYDLNIRSPEPDGSCVDVIRVRDRGKTLYESCGTAAGVKVVSNSDLVTLDLIASMRFYPARGFFLHYEVLGCPNILAPSGSYLSNGNTTSRKFQCKSGTVFPDTKKGERVLECKDGKWNETVDTLPSCVATSAVILKTENEHQHLASLSGDNVLGGGVRIGRGEDAVATGKGQIMDSAQSTMIKQADVFVDVVLPTVLIALLFVSNAIIVYIIFQYRKRKHPAVTQGEELALRNSAEIPQV